MPVLDYYKFDALTKKSEIADWHRTADVEDALCFLLDCPRTNVRIATHHRSILGFVGYTLKAERITIRQLLVIPGCRRAGIGRRLLHIVSLSGQSLGVTEISVEVMESDLRAQQFLRACGGAWAETLPSAGVEEDTYRFVVKL